MPGIMAQISALTPSIPNECNAVAFSSTTSASLARPFFLKGRRQICKSASVKLPCNSGAFISCTQALAATAPRRKNTPINYKEIREEQESLYYFIDSRFARYFSI